MPEIVVEFRTVLDRSDVEGLATEYGLEVTEFTDAWSKMSCSDDFEDSADMEDLSQEDVVKRLLRHDDRPYGPEGACFDLIIEFHETTGQAAIDALCDLFKLVVLDKLEDGKHRIYCPQREYMGTSDLEDLLESPEVKQLFWGDGSICRPRG